ncbi:MAG: hypothetical protein GX417_13480 [Clostridiales bacterium]|nr:hypothetical protein [Clostridiales bacterium]
MNLQPYCGNRKPFVYAAYFSGDAEHVVPVLERLQERGFALFPTERWNRRALRRAALVLLFVTQDASKSDAIQRIIEQASSEDVPILSVHLSPTELTPAQKLLLGTNQAILRDECISEAAFYEKLFGAQALQNLQVTPAQKRAAGLATWSVSGGVLLAAALAVVLALGVGATVPQDSTLAELGFSGRMREIREVWVYGDRTFDTCAEKVIASADYIDGAAEDRTVFFDSGADKTEAGMIEDISDFSQLRNLQRLSLAGNRIADISPLFTLGQLRYLDVSANPIHSIEGIGAMTSLETVYLGYTGVQEFSALLDCPALKEAFVDQTQQESARSALSPAGIKVTTVGPAEEMDKLRCHIYNGPFEGNMGEPYGVWYTPPSWAVYTDYSRRVTKNGEPVTISRIVFEDDDGDGAPDKTHLILSKASMGDYDTNAVYLLEITYEGRSVTYQIWHKSDSSHPKANDGLLLND